MDLNKHLYAGKRVFIVKDSRVFITSVRDVRDKDEALISVPVSRGAPVFIADGATIEVGFWEPNGIFSYRAVVTQGTWTDVTQTYRVKPCSKLIKLQRRENYRLPISCDVTLQILDDEEDAEFRTQTFNISLGGICVKSPRIYAKGTKMICHIDLNEKGTVEAAGKVVHHSKTNAVSDTYALGIEFTQCAPVELRRLARFMRALEIRRRRLL